MKGKKKAKKITIIMLVFSLLLQSAFVVSAETLSAAASGKAETPVKAETPANPSGNPEKAMMQKQKVKLHLLQDGYYNPHDYNAETISTTERAMTRAELIRSEEPVVPKISLQRHIANEMGKYNDKIDLTSYNLTYTDEKSREKVKQKVYKAIVDAINNNPELFYIDSTFSISQSIYINNQGEIIGGAIIQAEPSFYMTETKAKEIRKSFDATVKKALKKTKTTMNAAQKAKAVHDFLALHAEYDYKNYNSGNIPMRSYRANGVLVDKVGVCQSYALAYKYIMEKKLNIKCNYAFTDTHIWNLVKVGKKNYNVDVTWDDGGKKVVYYTYFLVGKKTMQNTHKGKKITFDSTPANSNYKHAAKPATSAIHKITVKDKSATLHWREANDGHGYQLYMTAKKGGKYKKVKTIKKHHNVKHTKKKLTHEKTYFFKVRAYKIVKGKRVYGKFSSVKSVKIKKPEQAEQSNR